MRAWILSVLITAMTAAVYAATPPDTGKSVKGFPFYVYRDGFSRSNHYVASGWMGDYGDMKFTDKWASNQQSGTTCIRIVYSGIKSQGYGWAGIYWQDPPNNWGEQKGGFNLSGATNLSFWARGERGNELVEAKIGGIDGDYFDTGFGSTGPVILGQEWKKFNIPLKGENLNRIIGGFCIVFSKDNNLSGLTLYLDDILYE